MTENKFNKQQLDGYKKMSGEERIRIASELSEMVREIARTGIRTQHPVFSKKEIEIELEKRISYGRPSSPCPYCGKV